MTTNATVETIIDNESISVRSAMVQPSGLDESTRSVSCVMSTENPVMMRDWNSGGIIDEVLLARGGQFPAQLPLLDNHSRSSSLDVLGSVRDIKVEGDKVTGRVYFAEGIQRAESVYQLVRQGHLTDVSVGYRYSPADSIDIPKGSSRTIDGREYKANERTIRVATTWQAKELSTTPIGADRLAKMRSLSDCKFRHAEEIAEKNQASNPGPNSLENQTKIREANQMSAVATVETTEVAPIQTASGETTRTEALQPLVASVAISAPSDIERARADGARAEQERVAFAQSFTGIRSDLVQQAITENWDRPTINERFLQSITTARPAPVAGSQAPAGHVVDNSARQENIQALFMVRAGLDLESPRIASDAFANKFTRGDEDDLSFMVRGARALQRGGAIEEQFDRALEYSNRYRSIHWVQACAMALDFAGVRYDRYNDRDIVTRAISTMSVAGMLSNALGATILDAFMGMEDTTDWVAEMTVPNNLPQPVIKGGNVSRLRKRTSGQTPVPAIKEATQEFISAATYSEQVFIDRIDLLSDRFGGLANTPTEIGMAAGEVVPDLVYSTMLLNPTMNDGNALFSVAHGNVAVNSPLGSETLAARKTAMANQSNNGRGVGAKPGFLVVPESISHSADVLLGSSEQRNTTASTQYGTKNWAQGKYQLRSETRLDVGCINPATEQFVAGRASDFYLIDRNRRFGFMKAFIRSSGNAPIVERWSPGDGRIGIGATVELDCGLAAVSWEGLQCGTGAGSR